MYIFAKQTWPDVPDQLVPETGVFLCDASHMLPRGWRRREVQHAGHVAQAELYVSLQDLVQAQGASSAACRTWLDAACLQHMIPCKGTPHWHGYVSAIM